MAITKRQEEILNRIIQEFIDSAQPVSSQSLEKKYDFGICPATIRIEMQKLTRKGFLSQPHTSAGKIPTDRGYRFFVNKLLEKKPTVSTQKKISFDLRDWFKIEVKDEIRFWQSLTKNLAIASQTLVTSYFFREKIFWKEGWEELIKQPEFKDKDGFVNFVKFLENFEKNFEGLKISSEIKVYIGKENPFSKIKDFSIIVSECHLPKKEKGIVSFLGPKRMAYSRNINLINSLIKTLEDF